LSGWIKMGTGLGSHPKVKTMRRALKADRLRVVGGLWAVWCVFDEHSAEGRLDGYTLDDMDEEIGWKGFSQAMSDIGWLVADADGLEAPDYEDHNGPNAKRRALDSSRKGKTRAKGSAEEPDDDPPSTGTHVRTKRGTVSASDADKTRNREEKRREELVPDEPDGSSSSAAADLAAGGEVSGKSVQPTIPCPYREIVGAYHDALPSLPKVRVFDGKGWDARCKAMRELWGWVLSSKRADGSRRAETGDAALAWVREYFALAAQNDFVLGRTRRSEEHKNWRCDIDYLLTSKGVIQVLEKTEVAA
jgi:hypothetical protein